MSEFEIGKTYQTRDGRDATLLAIVENNDQPLVFIRTEQDGKQWVEHYCKNGSYYNDGTIAGEDVMLPVNEWWINFYENLNPVVHASPGEADKCAAPGLIKCVHVREILE